MATRRPTIGLEVHAELKTATKMFCACKNDPDEARPNVNVCPICLAHPGTLPTINKEAVRHLTRIGAAVGGTLADFSEFDRKSYFYTDIPKGNQISQYEHPFVRGGTLAGVALTRVHLEEDTARSWHSKDKTLIDFNRAGIPLMELVTEPMITDAKTAGAFARELQLLLRTLGAGEANLEKGEMRIEANVSLRDGEALGTKVEGKNLNSFRSVERAIAYEIERQGALLERGERVVQETRGWDEEKQTTFSQRVKEGSADYRYFPEPDLPKMLLSEVSDMRVTDLPELPSERRARLIATGAFRPEQVATLVSRLELSAFIDAVAKELTHDTALLSLAANYLVSDLAGETGKITHDEFAKLMRMLAAGDLSSRGAKDLLVIMKESGGDPELLAQERGLIQVHDAGALRQAVRTVIEAHAKAADEYRGGKDAAFQYLVGEAMKVTGGAGNPSLLKKLLIQELKR